jgi:ribonuclease III
VKDEDDVVSAAEAAFGLSFRNRDLLRAALTHASAKPEEGRSNERLEFLGDAVLDFLVADYLYADRPTFDEGGLSKARARVVNKETLAAAARSLGLERRLVVGRTFAAPGKLSDSVLSDAFEAIVAAVYLDAGVDAARTFALPKLEAALKAALEGGDDRDWKSIFSAYAQALGKATPTYVVLSSAGPDHQKTFEVAAEWDSKRFPSSYGRGKREAEARAARAALRALGRPVD